MVESDERAAKVEGSTETKTTGGFEKRSARFWRTKGTVSCP
jgi:hypothetical protein